MWDFFFEGCDEILRQHKFACLRITALLSCKDLLWVGTSAGVILTISLPHIVPGMTKLTSSPTLTGTAIRIFRSISLPDSKNTVPFLRSKGVSCTPYHWNSVGCQADRLINGETPTFNRKLFWYVLCTKRHLPSTRSVTLHQQEEYSHVIKPAKGLFSNTGPLWTIYFLRYRVLVWTTVLQYIFSRLAAQ